MTNPKTRKLMMIGSFSQIELLRTAANPHAPRTRISQQHTSPCYSVKPTTPWRVIEPPSFSLLPRLVHSSLEMPKEQLYEVSHIVDEDYSNPNQRVFLIRWLGYTSDADSWEPIENLEYGAIEVVREWDKKKKQKHKRNASETKVDANTVKRSSSQIRDEPRKSSSGRVKSSQTVSIV